MSRADWHKEPCVLASSYLMRRREREQELLEDAEPWDLIVLDEAHHARRRGGGSGSDDRPNHLLRLMQQLRYRTQGPVLLTATPMQVSPVEVYDLLSLLGLPASWHAQAFLEFFEKDFAFRQPGMNRALRVTADPVYFDEHPESTELWSPGNPLFPQRRWSLWRAIPARLSLCC